MPRCGVPVRKDGTNVNKPAFIPSPDATLGDGDSAALCPYLGHSIICMYPTIVARRANGKLCQN
jgi:hypothetical protein